MDYVAYTKLELQTFVICTKFYLELENSYNNMCDSESGCSKEDIRKTETLMNTLNVFLNCFSQQIKI